MSVPMDQIRNVAIIAHVDHGKTTLVDELLKQSGTIAAHKELSERAMDSNDLERERGITILSKCTSVNWRDFKINIVDTPGHADFGGEVERVLKMVDSVLLLVDAFEGPMPQTRFVLNKALTLGLRPIVVINKIDRADSRPDEVLNLVFDLFVQLEATNEQLDFPVVYASARGGYAVMELADLKDKETNRLQPLFAAIAQHVPRPPGTREAPLRMQIATLDYNDYVGRLAIGRIFDGSVKQNQPVVLCRQDGRKDTCRVSKIYGFHGLERVEAKEAGAGDIVVLAGLPEVLPGETVCHPDHPNPMPLIKIDEPTVSMVFNINNSPFSGQDGKYVTSRQIKARLDKELEHNVSLRVEEVGEAFKVSGRGELHLSILIETMRREGYELSVGRPQVITRMIDGEVQEPIEELVIEVDEAYSGTIIDKLNQRRGEMLEMSVSEHGTTRLKYHVPTRGLIGLRSEFLTDTRGTGVMYHNFHHYGSVRGETPGRTNGTMIVQENGDTTAYALYTLQERGVLFVGNAEAVYGGQIIGLHSRENDIVVNPCKRKQLNNIRSAGADEALRLTPHRTFTLESALEMIEDDEMVEVTPKTIRIRKVDLDHNLRKRNEKSRKSTFE
jgi:GTP-binding protein